MIAELTSRPPGSFEETTLRPGPLKIGDLPNVVVSNEVDAPRSPHTAKGQCGNGQDLRTQPRMA